MDLIVLDIILDSGFDEVHQWYFPGIPKKGIKTDSSRQAMKKIRAGISESMSLAALWLLAGFVMVFEPLCAETLKKHTSLIGTFEKRAHRLLGARTWMYRFRDWKRKAPFQHWRGPITRCWCWSPLGRLRDPGTSIQRA